MSVLAPSRPLDEFEQLVYEYTLRMGLGEDSDENNKYWGIDAKSCNLRFESATKGPPPQVSYLLTIPQNLCNYMGNLHGGCTATLIDILSTTILLGMSRPGVFALGGVSRHLKTTYLRPVPQGTEVRLTCTLVQMGKRLAFLRADISRVDNGDICVLGEHEKANTDPAEEKL
ncbi:PaaI family thioesterase [Aspergillus glaucus CBS 516.65]|uniref:Thioesterase domain-containing protein n=1 Tax=Aspergillus glaucus CBS 516.65 TaxID=1160497 RepID=A0A1L9VEX7_ASPGL|nr:hypothetical protein ASPGLDRAFT_49166 [Aspergillus glaucus CBS 516.65]OJJ82382.1 hypothetical protein ASPGLDRAFT_49166 [Aspergillus glaucus CBS 516.65]